MSWRDTEPFLSFGGKIDPISEIRNAGIITNGSVFWVKSTSDSDYTTFQFQVGANIVLNDIQTAINKARTDKNDYVMVVPKDSNTAWTNTSNVGSAITISKNRLALVSVGYGKSVYGYSNTIQGLGSATAFDTAVVRVAASDTEIAGFRILGTTGTSANGTMSRALELGTAASGTAHQTWVHDCSIEVNNAAAGGANGTPDALTIGGTASNGARFDNVTFGNNVSNAKITLGNGNGRLEFTRCKMITAAQATADVGIAAGTGATDFVLFKECDFMNINTGTAFASLVTGSVTVLNPIIFSYCTGLGVTAFGTDPTVYTIPNQAGTAGAGVHNPGIALRGSAGLVVA
jgi:hypothetical protein